MKYHEDLSRLYEPECSVDHEGPTLRGSFGSQDNLERSGLHDWGMKI